MTGCPRQSKQCSARKAPDGSGGTARGQSGQALPLLLVAMGLGVVLISSLLYAVDARLVTARVQVARVKQEYAASAAAEFALAQLRNGSYCLASGATTVFTLPVSVNGVPSSATARCWTGGTGGATTWVTQTVPTTADLNGIFCLDASHCWAIGDEGAMLISSDGGLTWTVCTSCFPNSPDMEGVVFATSSCGWAVGEHPRELVRTANGGASWELVADQPSHTMLAVAYDGVSRGWAVGSNGTVVSVDCSGDTHDKSISTDYHLYGVDFVDANNGWVVGQHGTVYHTTNGAAGTTTWTRRDPDDGHDWDLYGVYFQTATRGWAVGEEGVIWYTIDAGLTWTQLPVDTHHTLRSICFSDANTGWIVGDDGTLLKSVDGGLTWQEVDLPTGENLVSINFADDPAHGWIVGNHGVMYRLSSGGGLPQFDIAATTNTPNPATVNARVEVSSTRSTVLSWQVK
jgi:photosystem II stability/assembly factor-like uncharacterized protein